MWWKKKPAQVGNADMPVWMTPEEFAQLLSAIEATGPRNFLEWGAGGSTLEILSRCPYIERYVAVEHNTEWYSQVIEHVTDSRLTAYNIPPSLLPDSSLTPKQMLDWNEETEHDPKIMASYIAHPATLGLRFDFILVDGRARRYCIDEGFKLLNPGGTLAIHDAQRTTYHDAILRQNGRALFVTPWEQGQICLIHKARESE